MLKTMISDEIINAIFDYRISTYETREDLRSENFQTQQTTLTGIKHKKQKMHLLFKKCTNGFKHRIMQHQQNYCTKAKFPPEKNRLIERKITSFADTSVNS